MRIAIIAITVLAALGCEDFETPAELEHEQIIAVQADPPAVMAGGAANLRVLVAGPDGIIEPDEVGYQSPTGTIDQLGVYHAPVNSVAGERAEITIDVLVGGRTLTAIKSIEIGAAEPGRNPSLGETQGAGQSTDGSTMQVEVGTELQVETELDDVAWYSNVVGIDAYRSNPTEVTSIRKDVGQIVAVVRDGQGGVAWIYWSAQAQP